LCLLSVVTCLISTHYARSPSSAPAIFYLGAPPRPSCCSGVLGVSWGPPVTGFTPSSVPRAGAPWGLGCFPPRPQGERLARQGALMLLQPLAHGFEDPRSHRRVVVDSSLSCARSRRMRGCTARLCPCPTLSRTSGTRRSLIALRARPPRPCSRSAGNASPRHAQA